MRKCMMVGGLKLPQERSTTGRCSRPLRALLGFSYASREAQTTCRSFTNPQTRLVTECCCGPRSNLPRANTVALPAKGL